MCPRYVKKEEKQNKDTSKFLFIVLIFIIISVFALTNYRKLLCWDGTQSHNLLQNEWQNVMHLMGGDSLAYVPLHQL